MQDNEEDIVEFSNQERNYFASIPNCIFHIGLNAFEISAYCHFRQIAGERGRCIKSNKNLCKQLCFGETKLKQVKKCLSMPRKQLGGLSLIKIISRTSKNGSPTSDMIQIIDIWRVNIEFIEKLDTKQVGRHATEGVGRHATEGGGSPRDYKEEQREQREREDLCKRAERTEKDRDARGNTNDSHVSVISERSLPFSKNEKKDWSEALDEDSRIFHDWAIQYQPSSGEKLDSGFVTAQIKKFGLQRVYLAMQYCIESLKNAPLRGSFGGFIRKAIECGWKLQDNKEKFLEYAYEKAKFCKKINVTKKYVTIEGIGVDFYYDKFESFEDFKIALDEKIELQQLTV